MMLLAVVCRWKVAQLNALNVGLPTDQGKARTADLPTGKQKAKATLEKNSKETELMKARKSTLRRKDGGRRTRRQERGEGGDAEKSARTAISCSVGTSQGTQEATMTADAAFTWTAALMKNG